MPQAVDLPVDSDDLYRTIWLLGSIIVSYAVFRAFDITSPVVQILVGFVAAVAVLIPVLVAMPDPDTDTDESSTDQ